MSSIDEHSTSGHLVHPELLDFTRMFPITRLDSETLQAARNVWAEVSVLPPLPDDAPVSREEVIIPSAEDGHQGRALLYRPARSTAALRPALIHIHGGGYVMGGPEMNDLSNRQVAERHDCIVLAPSYRLAPETVFPGAIEDCYAALAWLCRNAERLGIDLKRIVVTGESAGGGLAAALSIMARDRGEYEIAGQSLLYPMLDDRTGSTNQISPYNGEFIWPAAFNRFAWTSLLGGIPGDNGVSPYAAPARVEDVRGLPPTFLAVAALDLFFQENIEFGRRLATSGVPVEMVIYAGAVHGFDLVQDGTLAARFRRDEAAALRWMWTAAAVA
jgi:acetyl esterase/lipase